MLTLDDFIKSPLGKESYAGSSPATSPTGKRSPNVKSPASPVKISNKGVAASPSGPFKGEFPNKTAPAASSVERAADSGNQGTKIMLSDDESADEEEGEESEEEARLPSKLTGSSSSSKSSASTASRPQQQQQQQQNNKATAKPAQQQVSPRQKAEGNAGQSGTGKPGDKASTTVRTRSTTPATPRGTARSTPRGTPRGTQSSSTPRGVVRRRVSSSSSGTFEEMMMSNSKSNSNKSKVRHEVGDHVEFWSGHEWLAAVVEELVVLNDKENAMPSMLKLSSTLGETWIAPKKVRPTSREFRSSTEEPTLKASLAHANSPETVRRMLHEQDLSPVHQAAWQNGLFASFSRKPGQAAGPALKLPPGRLVESKVTRGDQAKVWVYELQDWIDAKVEKILAYDTWSPSSWQQRCQVFGCGSAKLIVETDQLKDKLPGVPVDAAKTVEYWAEPHEVVGVRMQPLAPDWVSGMRSNIYNCVSVGASECPRDRVWPIPGVKWILPMDHDRRVSRSRLSGRPKLEITIVGAKGPLAGAAQSGVSIFVVCSVNQRPYLTFATKAEAACAPPAVTCWDHVQTLAECAVDDELRFQVAMKHGKAQKPQIFGSTVLTANSFHQKGFEGVLRILNARRAEIGGLEVKIEVLPQPPVTASLRTYVKIRHLELKENLSQPIPMFCAVAVTGSSQACFRTKVIQDVQKPTWDEEGELEQWNEGMGLEVKLMIIPKGQIDPVQLACIQMNSWEFQSRGFVGVRPLKLEQSGFPEMKLALTVFVEVPEKQDDASTGDDQTRVLGDDSGGYLSGLDATAFPAMPTSGGQLQGPAPDGIGQVYLTDPATGRLWPTGIPEPAQESGQVIIQVNLDGLTPPPQCRDLPKLHTVCEVLLRDPEHADSAVGGDPTGAGVPKQWLQSNILEHGAQPAWFDPLVLTPVQLDDLVDVRIVGSEQDPSTAEAGVPMSPESSIVLATGRVRVRDLIAQGQDGALRLTYPWTHDAEAAAPDSAEKETELRVRVHYSTAQATTGPQQPGPAEPGPQSPVTQNAAAAALGPGAPPGSPMMQPQVIPGNWQPSHGQPNSIHAPLTSPPGSPGAQQQASWLGPQQRPQMQPPWTQPPMGGLPASSPGSPTVPQGSTPGSPAMQQQVHPFQGQQAFPGQPPVAPGSPAQQFPGGVAGGGLQAPAGGWQPAPGQRMLGQPAGAYPQQLPAQMFPWGLQPAHGQLTPPLPAGSFPAQLQPGQPQLGPPHGSDVHAWNQPQRMHQGVGASPTPMRTQQVPGRAAGTGDVVTDLRAELSQVLPPDMALEDLPKVLQGAPPEVLAIVLEIVYQIARNLDDDNEYLIYLLSRDGYPGGRLCVDAQDRLWAAEALLETYPEQWFTKVMQVILDLRTENATLHEIQMGFLDTMTTRPGSPQSGMSNFVQQMQNDNMDMAARLAARDAYKACEGELMELEYLRAEIIQQEILDDAFDPIMREIQRIGGYHSGGKSV
eukprot:TRINITY_DN467_c1_g1_i1.p1 TRINITY_DN467_c1_g1~~TRINITY_DN467_c1_g1_i1.p1  ORF type:complete len:1472 (-),score=301.98 TRINITY_DN467_c1_g1_i1:831-5246(-)